MADSPFFGPSYQRASRIASIQRTVNMYLDPLETGNERAQYKLTDMPGLVKVTQTYAPIPPAPTPPPPPAPGCICDDGPEWNATVIPLANWRYSAFGNGRFVAIGNLSNGNIASAISTDLGATWNTLTDIGLELGGSSGQIVFGAGLFVTTINAVNYATSPNGVDWTIRNYASTSPSGFVLGNGTFVLFPATGTTIRTSVDGLTFVGRTAPASRDYVAAAYGNGRFIGVAQDLAIYSTDGGATWAGSTTTWPDSGWQTAAFGAGVFVILNKNESGAPVVKWSADGDVWTPADLPFDGSSFYDGLMFSKGRFIATKRNSAQVAVSLDGKVWTLATHPTPDALSRYGALATDGLGSYIALNTFHAGGVTNAAHGVCCFGEAG